MPVHESSSPAYGHGDDWQFIDNVQMAIFEFGKDRELTTDQVREPIVDVACLEGNPTGDLLAAAELASVSKVDKMMTLWASTLTQNDIGVEPKDGDLLTIGTKKWLIVSVVSTVFDTQFKCLCKRLSRVTS